MPVEQDNPKAIGRIFVQILLIFPYKSGENHENSEPRWKT